MSVRRKAGSNAANFAELFQSRQHSSEQIRKSHVCLLAAAACTRDRHCVCQYCSAVAAGQITRFETAFVPAFPGGVEPTVIYTLSKKEADDIGASLRV